jgi:hypothetical protein
VDDAARREEIARLQHQLADARAQRAALLEDIVHLAARIPEMRRAFGNPFYYTHPEEPDEGIANYNPTPGDEQGWMTWRSLRRVQRELERIRTDLRRFGDDATPH